MVLSALQVIELHVLAPMKPVYGARCNGCGVCCAAQPCPVAHLFLLQFKGSCRALTWQDHAGRYVCGLVVKPDHFIKLIPARLRESAARFFASRIDAGAGCDSEVEMNPHQ